MGDLDFEKSLAVVIGINQYSNGITPLRTAVADARSVTHLLEQEHGYQVLSLLDEEAQLAELKNLIQKILPSLLSANSRLLLYFAGHGIAQDGDDGPAGYLIPQDAVPGDVGSYLSMVLLHDELTALSCRHFLAIFDCCFAGAFRWASTRKVTVVSEVIHRERYDRFRQDPAWQVITSASYDQPAMDVLSLRDERGAVVDSRDQQHSPFAAALLQALQGDADLSPPAKDGSPAGDGVITATELYLYLREQVEVLTESQSLRQTPEICTLRNHDKGEYIFLTPGHELNLPPAPELNKENNPYRGLESFDQEHKDLFFGRDTEIERLLKRLDAPHPMIVVLGASGTGKSSLVKAGLLPRVADNPAFQVLPVMRPGSYPLDALARACMSLEAVDEAKSLSEQFAADETVLSQLIGQWQQTHPKTKLLLAIDQTEELITQASAQAQSSLFQRLVKRAMADHWQHFRVVATLRLDFEAQFQDEELREGWMDSRFVIPPMSQAQLREAIEKPAAARVLYFEPSSLIDLLVEDVAQTPGALPLLSFMLSELYLRYLERRSDNRALTEADYRALGGVSGALTQRATQEYESLVSEDDAYENTVKHVMLRMVALEGGELARRRVSLPELVYADKTENERVQKLLENLIAARLVVRGREGDGEPYVEPAHDALVRGWDKLLRWRNQEQLNISLQRQLTPQACNWKEVSHNKKGYLWDENPRLDLLKEVLNSKGNWLNAVESDFIFSSIVRRRNRRRFLFSLGTTLVTAFSFVTLDQAIHRFYLRPNEIGRLEIQSTDGKDLEHATAIFFLEDDGSKQYIQWNTRIPYLDGIPKGLYFAAVEGTDYINTLPIKIDGYEDYFNPVSIRVPSNKKFSNVMDGMAFVPQGEIFVSASGDNQFTGSVVVNDFYIDKYEVTNQKYSDFLSEIDADSLSHQVFYSDQPPFKKDRDSHQPNDWMEPYYESFSATDDHPVINIDWYDAFAYCAWQGKRLPTVLEWERAALPTNTQGQTLPSKYPWGNELDIARANTKDSGIGETQAVGSYPEGASVYGVFDLIGNALEWTDGWQISSFRQGQAEFSPDYRQQALKGGSFSREQYVTEVRETFLQDAVHRSLQYGFRCALSRVSP